MGVLLAFSLGSCKSIFEDMDSCPDVGIWVRAVLPASSGFTASPDDIESVRMYVFDQNENLLQIYDAEYE